MRQFPDKRMPRSETYQVSSNALFHRRLDSPYHYGPATLLPHYILGGRERGWLGGGGLTTVSKHSRGSGGNTQPHGTRIVPVSAEADFLKACLGVGSIVELGVVRFTLE